MGAEQGVLPRLNPCTPLHVPNLPQATLPCYVCHVPLAAWPLLHPAWQVREKQRIEEGLAAEKTAADAAKAAGLDGIASPDSADGACCGGSGACNEVSRGRALGLCMELLLCCCAQGAGIPSRLLPAPTSGVCQQLLPALLPRCS